MTIDYADNKLERNQDLKKNGRRRVKNWVLGTALGIAGLTTVVVGYELDLPYIRKAVKPLGIVLEDSRNYITHGLCLDTEEIDITQGMTINDLGKSRGLSGRRLGSWVDTVIDNNLALKTTRPDIGITPEGKLIAGKKLELITCY